MNRGLVYRVLRALAVLFFAAVTTSAMAVGYSAQAGKIFDPSGQEIQVRGVSHHGFNSTILQPQFLWAMGWKEQIAQMKSLGFNAIRVPFVPDTLYNTTPVNQLSYVDPTLNPELIGKTPLQVLDLWMAEADRQGMYVLLDFHSVTMQWQYPTWFLSNPADFNLIYNNQAYTKENWTRDLVFVAQRYANLGHFLGIDLYNEPHDSVRWGAGDANVPNPIYFWRAAAEFASAAVLAANPNLLIFVQGTTANWDGIENSNIAMNWGENFQPQAYQPLNIPNDKLVLTPHTYGPDVFMKSSFSAANFPANLAADWEALFGKFSPTRSIVIGEFGGKYGPGTGGQQDVTWQNAFVDYLIGKGMRNSFYWCYTPNSSDTGGILDDNLNVRQDKMALLQRLWGTPPAPLPSEAIFGDAVTPLWQLSAWSATATIQNQFVKAGSALKVDASTWGGMSLDSRDVNWAWTDQPANRYTHLSFDVSAGAVVGAGMSTLRASLDDAFNAPVNISPNYVPSFAANTWYHVEIPLSLMNPQGAAFRKIAFQNNDTSNLTFFIDNVILVNKGGGPGPDTVAPSTPAGLTATAVSSSQINLSWTASTDNVAVTGYKVFKAGVQVATTTTTSYSDTGLAASTAYSYAVSAFDAAGNVSAQSAAAGATTLAIAGTTIFDDAVTPLWQLSAWTATAAVQSQFTKSGVGALKVDAGTWGGMSLDSRDANWVWTDQPANRYTHVSFDVSAGAAVGAGMSTLRASLDDAFNAPVNISNYVTSFAANTWYHVEIPLSLMNPQGAAFRKITFQNNSQSNLTFYIDNVVLVSQSGGDTVAPSTPTGLTASAVSSQQINLSWTASTDNVGVTGYKVFKGGAQLATTTASSYSSTGLTASTAYSYTVSAFDAAGNASPQSAAAGATTTAGGGGAQLQSCAGIMPLGDSITAGTSGNYRNDLYTGLLDNTCGVSYAGTLTDSNALHHEGHGGLSIGDQNQPNPPTIANGVNGWMTTTQPNVILLMIGTNDTAWWTNETASQHGARHNRLITQIQAQFQTLNRPDAWIFVASIPLQRSANIHLLPYGNELCDGSPCTTGDRAVLVRDFNAEIQRNVDARVANGEHVRFVDVYSALTVDDLEPLFVNGMLAGVHPKDPAAYSKIAAKFLEAIRAALASGM